MIFPTLSAQCSYWNFLRLSSAKALWLLLILSLISCKQESVEERPLRKHHFCLHQDEAILRFSQVSQIHYKTQLDFTDNHEGYKGKTEITFDYSGSGKLLHLDFTGGKIQNLTLNNQPLNAAYNGEKIQFETFRLNKGSNNLLIEFEQQFHPEGYGLERIQDPEDQRIYLRSNLAPAYTNYLFPCFDQPDLTAHFTLSVIAPFSWQVISISQATFNEATPEALSWAFQTTDAISPHTFSLFAGDYKKVTLGSEEKPVTLYHRHGFDSQSMQQTISAAIQQGSLALQTYFKTSSPITEKQAIILPLAFNAQNKGGLITLSESLEPASIVENIIYSLCNQWLYYYLPIKWWNLYLLQDGLAHYITDSHLQHLPETAQTFWLWRFNAKHIAKRLDQKPSATAVLNDIKSSQQAELLIENSQSGKAYAALQQLIAGLDQETLQIQMQQLITSQKRRPAGVSHIIHSLSDSSSQTIPDWVQQWLYEPGINRLIIDPLCEQGHLTKLGIHQKATFTYPSLRHHQAVIGSLEQTQRGLVVTNQKPYSITGATSLIESAKGLACGKALFLNTENLGYFIQTLDKRSLTYLLSNVNEIANPELKLLLWSHFSDLLREKKLTLAQYQTLLLQALSEESNTQALTFLLNELYPLDPTHHYPYYPLIYMLYEHDKKSYQALIRELESIAWQQIKHAQPDNKTLWLTCLTRLSESQSSLEQLAQLLTDKTPFEGLSLSQSMRWQIIKRLIETTFKGAEALLTTEIQKDKSYRGKLASLACEAARPNYKIKLTLLDKLLADRSPYSREEQRIILGSLFPLSQHAEIKRFKEIFYQKLLVIKDEKNLIKINNLLTLIPKECTKSSLSERFLLVHKMLPDTISKALRNNQFESDICYTLQTPSQSSKIKHE